MPPFLCFNLWIGKKRALANAGKKKRFPKKTLSEITLQD